MSCCLEIYLLTVEFCRCILLDAGDDCIFVLSEFCGLDLPVLAIRRIESPADGKRVDEPLDGSEALLKTRGNDGKLLRRVDD